MQDFQASLIASFISVLIFSPTDVIRTKLNLKSQPITKMFNHIYKAEGIKGFYRGLAVSATATPLCTGLYFSLYEKMKISMHSIESTKISSNLAASIITGFICNTITNPLWVLKNRIQTSNRGFKQNFNDIYQQNGMKGYFKGLATSYLGLSHMAIYFPLYEMLKDKVVLKYVDNQQANILVSSSLSKLISIILTYPSNVLQVKIQCSQENTSALNIIKQIYNQNGLKGFFSGIKIDVARSIPANSLTFLVYELLKNKQNQRQSAI